VLMTFLTKRRKPKSGPFMRDVAQHIIIRMFKVERKLAVDALKQENRQTTTDIAMRPTNMAIVFRINKYLSIMKLYKLHAFSLFKATDVVKWMDEANAMNEDVKTIDPKFSQDFGSCFNRVVTSLENHIIRNRCTVCDKEAEEGYGLILTKTKVTSFDVFKCTGQRVHKKCS